MKRVKRGRRLAAALLGMALAGPTLAQEADQDLRQEIEDLKAGQAAIQKELAEIKKLITARAAPAAPAGPNVADKVFDLRDNPVLGPSTAKVTLVEFTDYQ